MSNVKTYGLLEVMKFKKFVQFCYMGNMSTREDVEIAQAVEALYGVGSFERLLSLGTFSARDPSYSWVIAVPRTDWEF